MVTKAEGPLQHVSLQEIAADRPHGTRIIGSFEAWAHTLGGVLDVAGVPDFLGNIEEMMEASDSEGAAWSAFIGAWWDRFGTAAVGVADLFGVALSCDPVPPMEGQTDHARKTNFGFTIKKMRDRVFRVGDINLRLQKAGVYQRAIRWKLELCEEKQSG